MSKNQEFFPNVVLDEQEYTVKGRTVSRVVCKDCLKSALIPHTDLGTPDQDANMLRNNMCADAILAAAKMLDARTL